MPQVGGSCGIELVVRRPRSGEEIGDEVVAADSPPARDGVSLETPNS